MPVDVITTREQLSGVRFDWDRVYQSDCEAQVFISWQWIWDLYDRRNEDPFIVVYRPANMQGLAELPVAFMPMRLQLKIDSSNSQFYQVCSMAGNDWADYTGLICQSEFEREAIDAIACYLQSKHWQVLQLKCIKISDCRLELFLASFGLNRYSLRERQYRDSTDATDLLRSPLITLPSTYESYLADNLSANARQRVRRFSRKLENDAALSVEMSNETTIDTDLDAFEDLWIERWSDNKGEKVEGLAERYALILEQAFDAGYLLQAVFRHSDKIVGTIACLRDEPKKTLRFYVAARDLAFDSLPLGTLLHVWMIRFAIENGFTYYDFLSGDEPYKYSLGGVDQLIRYIEITRQQSNGNAIEFDDKLLKLALKKLRRYQRNAERKSVKRLYAQLLPHDNVNGSVQLQFSRWQKMNNG